LVQLNAFARSIGHSVVSDRALEFDFRAQPLEIPVNHSYRQLPAIASKRDRAVARVAQRRVRLARFPVLKTLDQFNWSWPKKINRLQVQNLFRLKFIEDKANVIFLGGVGLGKSHLTTALGYAACLQGYSVRFTTAIDAVNTLSAAHGSGRPKTES
jgi:DNA replication protein DnaC